MWGKEKRRLNNGVPFGIPAGEPTLPWARFKWSGVMVGSGGEKWDRQIEADSESGKLDFLIEETLVKKAKRLWVWIGIHDEYGMN